MRLPQTCPFALLGNNPRPPSEVYPRTLKLADTALLHPAAPFKVSVHIDETLHGFGQVRNDGFREGMRQDLLCSVSCVSRDVRERLQQRHSSLRRRGCRRGERRKRAMKNRGPFGIRMRRRRQWPWSTMGRYRGVRVCVGRLSQDIIYSVVREEWRGMCLDIIPRGIYEVKI